MSNVDLTPIDAVPLDESWRPWWRVLRAPGSYREEQGQASADPMLELGRAFAALVDDQDDDAARLLAKAANGVAAGAWRAVASALHALVLARQGVAGTREVLDAARSEAGGEELPAAWVDLAGALLELERGQRSAALQALVGLAGRFGAHRESIGKIFALVWAGRIELLLGRTARGRSRLSTAAEAARHLGLGALAELAERSFTVELLPDPRGPREAPGSPGRSALARRARAIDAFWAAAGASDETLAEALLESTARQVEGQDHAVERLILAAGRAFLERRRGSIPALQAHLREAARLAADGGIDPDHYLVLAQLVKQTQIIREGRRSLACRDAAALDGAELVLDSLRHELRAGDRVISFRKKPVVRKLFYALAARAGRALTKDVLARAAWETDYNPLVHEDVLRVNIQHLRRAIEPVGMALWFDDVGYRLDAPSGFVYIETLSGLVP